MLTWPTGREANFFCDIFDDDWGHCRLQGNNVDSTLAWETQGQMKPWDISMLCLMR